MSNLVSAKIFFGLVLQELQNAFPVALHVTEKQIWPEFERLANDQEVTLRYKRSFRSYPVTQVAENELQRQRYTNQMVSWMAAEGFLVSDPMGNFRLDFVLSAKSLALLNVEIGDDKMSVSAKLMKAFDTVRDKATGKIVAEIIDGALSAVTDLPT